MFTDDSQRLRELHSSPLIQRSSRSTWVELEVIYTITWDQLLMVKRDRLRTCISSVKIIPGSLFLSYIRSPMGGLIRLSRCLSSREIFIWDSLQWEDPNNCWCRVSRRRSVVAEIETLHWVEPVDGVRLQSGQLATAQRLRVNAARCQQRLVGINGAVVDRWRHAHVIRHAAAVICKTNSRHLAVGVSRQLVYGHFVYDTSSTDISSTDISSTMTPFVAEIEAGVMKRKLCQ